MSKLDKWLRKSCHHYTDFNDIGELVELKREQNLKISLCFPTLNEERTIGKSIVVMKSELMDRYPLLDEIAVIDSGSSDKTRVIAEKFGADTYLAADCLKEKGECRGKGENLWKALHLLKGDVIVYVDADISNIHHRFAYGLIGPLLKRRGIKFVKAFYNRPYKSSSGISPKGGGRVTEILVRPLFSQFFPELSGIIQPLSGEYAGFREVFEEIPFPIGYGVETGMLIDVFQKWGVDVIAQTNLDLRIHRNQEILSLGKMSFGILQTFWDRLHRYKKLGPMKLESHILRQIELLGNDYKIQEYDIREREREPMVEVKAYRKKRKKS